MKSLKDIGFKNYCVTSCGKVYSLHSNKYLKPKIDRYGYQAVCLRSDGKNHHRTVHRLVATVYVEGYQEDLEVNHKDGNKLNNNSSNLEWVTSRNNTRHAIESGLMSGTVLTDEDVHRICSFIQDGYRNCDIKQIRGINSIDTIERIKSGKYYTDISSEYDFKANSLGRRQTISTPKIIKSCEMLEQGFKVVDIANEVGCSVGTVYRIKNRTRFTKISNNYSWK